MDQVILDFIPTYKLITDNINADPELLISQIRTCDRVALYDIPQTQFVHLIAAALFLLVLAYMSWALFTRSDHSKPKTGEKKKRNIIYRVCALTILVCVILSAMIFFVKPEWIESAFKPIFWLESVALWAFGLSWLIKGETFLAD